MREASAPAPSTSNRGPKEMRIECEQPSGEMVHVCHEPATTVKDFQEPVSQGEDEQVSQQ